MLRKIIGAALGLALLGSAFMVAGSLIGSNKRPVREVPQTIKTVFTQQVINSEVPIIVNASGNLVASQKIELFAEVQGTFQGTPKPFKTGQNYRKGDLLLSIDSREFYTSLLAQRSGLYDLITSMMPDLKFDYPEVYERWYGYLETFDIQQPIRPLPEPESDKEKYFITGKQIITTYYNIKNLEERLQKYAIRAPFDGILTEAEVNVGTLIRSGQKLGEFVSTGDFELEVAVNNEYLDRMRVGEQVALTDLSGSREWTGTVRRVNGRLNQETQTVNVFIGVRGKGLIEGMYMEAKIAAISATNALEIPRNLLINERELFVVEDSKLSVKEVEPVYFTDRTAVVKGLEDNTQLVSRPIVGAYAGMPVKVAATSNPLSL